MKKLEIIKLYVTNRNMGDGSITLHYFFNKDDALEFEQEYDNEAVEINNNIIETFVGSNIYLKAK